MKNWKTTLFGIIGALGVSLLASNDSTLHTIGVIIAALGVLGNGAMAKDKNVTGGNTDNNIK
jgi:hypothetical protein